MSEQVNFDNWIEIAYCLRYGEGKSYEEIIPVVKHLFPGKSDVQIYERIRKTTKKLHKQQGGIYKNYSRGLLPSNIEPDALKQLTKAELLKLLFGGGIEKEKADEKQIADLRWDGYRIKEENGKYKLDKSIAEYAVDTPKVEMPWSGCEVIRFGLISDTHINSKYTQLTYLHKFYDICKAEGITEIYHAGDIDEGEQMRVGHQYECYKQGADDHVHEIVRVYPKREGIKTYFITGNHDASIIKRCGYDIGYAIAAKRSDMIYLGSNEADVNLTPNCVLQLRHPWDGTAYSISYKVQKMIDAMSGGTKPNILAVGHYHKAEYIFYRNVHAFQTGCFQSETPFTRGKAISVHTGGWIITAQVDKQTGELKSVNGTFIPFYVGVKDDYEKWAGFTAE